MTDLQRKFRYTVNILFNSSGNDAGIEYDVDEFSGGDMKKEIVKTKIQKFGEQSLTAARGYDEIMLRLALRNQDDFETLLTNLQRIDNPNLEDPNDNDIDTIDVTINFKKDLNGQEVVTYSRLYQNCRLSGFKVDQVTRVADDAMLHVEVSLQPGTARDLVIENIA